MVSAQASPSLIAVAHQVGGDRIAVGLVVDQNAAEGVAGPGLSVPSKVRRSVPSSVR